LPDCEDAKADANGDLRQTQTAKNSNPSVGRMHNAVNRGYDGSVTGGYQSGGGYQLY